MSLPVWFEDERVGTITADRNGPVFSYEPSWLQMNGAFPISVRMPLQAGWFSPDILLPWLQNLLPENTTLNHAQTIGDQRRGKHIQRRHWMRMAQECGLSQSGVIRRVLRSADAVLHELDPAVDIIRAMPAGDHPVLNIARDEIRKLCVTVRRNAERSDDSGC